MILRDLIDNRKESLSVLSNTVQKSLDETKKSCNKLIANGLIEIVGKEYVLTAKDFFFFSQCRYRLIDTKSMEVQTTLQSWKKPFLFLENSQAVPIASRFTFIISVVMVSIRS